MKEKYDKISLKASINDLNLRRLPLDTYKQMSKKELIKHFHGFLAKFDALRYQLIEIKLENNYLQRRIEMLVDQLNFYKAQAEKRTFKHGIPENKIK